MKKVFTLGLVLYLFSSCSTIKTTDPGKEDGKIKVNFLLINDVYEIAPLSEGREGGMARVASLKKKYQAENPNTFLVLAGDFLSPSVYNSLRYQNKAIRGRQMVDAMNAAGVDFVTFGNHEFDIREDELQERIDESKFLWISSNTFHKTKDGIVPFAKTKGSQVPLTHVINVKDADGTEARIGFIGLCLPFNKADYVSYEDPFQTAKKLYNQLKDSVDAVVAITHQTIEDDEKLAKEVPGLAVILGGHEHDQRFKKVGNIYIVKALANARSAYAVELKINKAKHKVEVDPDLEKIDERLMPDSLTDAVVQKWSAIADSSYSAIGFMAKKIVAADGEAWDGREVAIRHRPTNLTRLLAKSMKAAVPNADVVLFNAGSVRVDDILHKPVTQYDIIRALPFGGGITQVDMKGELLVKVLEQGKNNEGSGGFLIHNEEVSQNKAGQWMLNQQAIDPVNTYHVAMSDFLITGREANLGFLTAYNPDIIKIYEIPKPGTAASDIRLALIRYLQDKGGF